MENGWPSGTAVWVAPTGAVGHAEQSAAVRRLLRAALAKPRQEGLLWLGELPPEEGMPLPPETRGPHGKPYPDGIETPAGRRYVSLSHVRGWAAAAVSVQPVGVDLCLPPEEERVRRLLRFLREEERSLLAAAPAAVWAAKESAGKRTGEGLAGFAREPLTACAGGYMTPSARIFCRERDGVTVGVALARGKAENFGEYG